MMCFNFMEQQGAFSRNAEGLYQIDFEKSKAAVNAWADLILTTGRPHPDHPGQW